MALGPLVSAIYFGTFIFGLFGLVLSVIGVGWFVVHPKETGESLLRGKRGMMFALCVVVVPLTVVCALALALLVFAV